MVRNVFFDPDRFFRERDELTLLQPLLVLILAGLASVFSTLVLLISIPGSGMGTGPFVVLSILLNAPISFGWLLLQCGLYTGTFHLLSSVLGGNGSLDTTFKVTAWGFVPVVFVGLLDPVMRYLAYGGGNGVATFAFLSGVRASTSGHSMLLLNAFGLVFTLWQAVIWLFGVRRTHHLPLRRAVVVVGIPVAVALFLSVGSAVVSMTNVF
ncbi:Yip1 family protein [Halococcus hamelinensis]|uniref:Yip1 domain-containing protein n=1 Tax=Halococcus hamelinensis 100A6 TaxID=1132509 RepID=M0M724_9EURY|nr:Yip1 family protein [Halococcus hamelinensis]EMA40180.1 hypothetical protein C447_04592 [Halococcus hamelinensis 100A6]